MQQRNSADVLRAGKLVAFVAAGLIFVAALLDALLFFGVTAGDPPNPFFFDFDYGKRFSITQSLAEEHLRETWAWNLRAFPSQLFSDLLLASGLFCVAFVAWVLTKAYRASGGLAAKIMFLFFCFGAVVPAVGFLQNMGSTTAGDRLFSAWQNPSNFYRDADILVSLQLSYLMSVGRSVWIQALLYVLLGGGFWFCGFLGLIHSSELRANRLPRVFKWHSLFSFFVGFFGFVVFSADVSKFFLFNFDRWYAFVTVIYMVLLIPAWTVWLGLILPRIPAEFMKGVVVATGPAYAELGELGGGVRADEMSVEMEEQPRSRSAGLGTSSSDENNVVEDDADDSSVVEITL